VKSQETSYYTPRQTSHPLRQNRVTLAGLRRLDRDSRTDEEQLARLEARGAGDCDEARNLRTKIHTAKIDSELADLPLAPDEADEKPLLAPKHKRAARKRRNKPASLN
jgi:hypothetical protein